MHGSRTSLQCSREGPEALNPEPSCLCLLWRLHSQHGGARHVAHLHSTLLVYPKAMRVCVRKQWDRRCQILSAESFRWLRAEHLGTLTIKGGVEIRRFGVVGQIMGSGLRCSRDMSTNDQ